MFAACGGGDDDDGKVADSGPTFDAADEVTPDAGDTQACPEFATPAGTISTFPGTFSGDIVGATNDFDVAAGVCTDERDHFEQVGEDAVVELTGLTAGAEYFVDLSSAADLSFYVATGCADPSLTGECLLFVDSGLSGEGETAPFIAPASGSAFVIVDSFFGPKDTTDGTFTISVAEPECSEDTDCTDAGTPFCSDRTCVACRDSFDCTDSAAPVCGGDGSCGVGATDCTDDIDDDLQDNDGPAGATVLTSGDVSNAAICNTPGPTTPEAERDYFSVTLADTADLDVSVVFADVAPNDLDVRVLDSEGVAMGLSFYLNPEDVNLTFLPAGEYFVEVTYFGNAITAALPYTVTATVTDNGDCATATDCAAEFSTQFYRGSCDVATGACTAIEGAAALLQGAACDTSDDCTSGVCSNALSFQANAQDSVCTIDCTVTADCAALTGFTCTVPFGVQNYCRPACATNLDCGVVDLNSADLDAGEPWDYLTCTAGACDVDPV